MAELVPIPWQPHLFLTPHTLGYLVSACNYYGAYLYLNDDDWERISPAWRSYSQQATAYRKWLARTGPVASNPDTGQRNHMRGAAFDLRLTSARAQAACRLAGLVRDSQESWHWNDPAATSMPIIPNRTSAASAEATLIPEEDEDMPARPYTTDGGKTFRIMFEDGRSKPLIDYRDGKPMRSEVVVALNLFLRYDPTYYPNGKRGAAVLSAATAHQFGLALDPSGSQIA